MTKSEKIRENYAKKIGRYYTCTVKDSVYGILEATQELTIKRYKDRWGVYGDYDFITPSFSGSLGYIFKKIEKDYILV